VLRKLLGIAILWLLIKVLAASLLTLQQFHLPISTLVIQLLEETISLTTVRWFLDIQMVTAEQLMFQKLMFKLTQTKLLALKVDASKVL
jgi:hypothetical protein